MTVNQQKSQIIDKKDTISLIFKDILCFQSTSKHISPILQIFDGPGSVSLFQGYQSPKFYKLCFLGD